MIPESSSVRFLCQIPRKNLSFLKWHSKYHWLKTHRLLIHIWNTLGIDVRDGSRIRDGRGCDNAPLAVQRASDMPSCLILPPIGTPRGADEPRGAFCYLIFSRFVSTCLYTAKNSFSHSGRPPNDSTTTPSITKTFRRPPR